MSDIKKFQAAVDKLAIVGTKNGISLPNAHFDSEFETALLQLKQQNEQESGLSNEQLLIQTLSLFSQYYHVGANFSFQLDEKAQQSDSESGDYCSDEVSLLLERVIDLGNDKLLTLLLNKLNKANLIIKPQHLTLMLDVADGSANIQPIDLAYLGERGLWLAAQQDNWQQVLDIHQQPWQVMTGAKRYIAFVAVILKNKALAMAQLSEIFKKESAKERLALLERVIKNHAVSDLEYFTALKKDRSAGVRNLAFRQRAYMNDASLYQEIIAKLDSVLTLVSKDEKIEAIEVDFTLGASGDDTFDLSAWGFEVKDKYYLDGNTIGRKTYTIYWLLSLLPPSVIAEHYQLSVTRWVELIFANTHRELINATISGALLSQQSSCLDAVQSHFNGQALPAGAVYQWFEWFEKVSGHRGYCSPIAKIKIVNWALSSETLAAHSKLDKLQQASTLFYVVNALRELSPDDFFTKEQSLNFIALFEQTSRDYNINDTFALNIFSLGLRLHPDVFEAIEPRLIALISAGAQFDTDNIFLIRSHESLQQMLKIYQLRVAIDRAKIGN